MLSSPIKGYYFMNFFVGVYFFFFIFYFSGFLVQRFLFFVIIFFLCVSYFISSFPSFWSINYYSWKWILLLMTDGFLRFQRNNFGVTHLLTGIHPSLCFFNNNFTNEATANSLWKWKRNASSLSPALGIALKVLHGCYWRTCCRLSWSTVESFML